MTKWPVGGPKTTPQQRAEIVRVYLEVSPFAAQQIATNLGLKPDYAYRLVQGLGLNPRTRKIWGKLRESA